MIKKSFFTLLIFNYVFCTMQSDKQWLFGLWKISCCFFCRDSNLIHSSRQKWKRVDLGKRKLENDLPCCNKNSTTPTRLYPAAKWSGVECLPSKSLQLTICGWSRTTFLTNSRSPIEKGKTLYLKKDTIVHSLFQIS